MQLNNDIEFYLRTMVSEGLYTNEHNLRMMLDYVFKDVDFYGKSVLEIGGGSGLCSLYASCCGAEKVVCLEPEADGSTLSAGDKFNNLKKILKKDNVSLYSQTFQEFDSSNLKFDIVLLNNSINHLNEISCINLQNDKDSRNDYSLIFRKLFKLCNRKAKVIICDCSSSNFFNCIKITNPFSPSIEWRKHQPPKQWVKLLIDVGFECEKIRWTSFNSLGRLGRFLLGNRFISFFLLSHFCLTVTKPSASSDR